MKNTLRTILGQQLLWTSSNLSIKQLIQKCLHQKRQKLHSIIFLQKGKEEMGSRIFVR